MFLKSLIVVSAIAGCVLGQKRAGVVLAGKDNVKGSIVFTETADGVQINGQITGLEPGMHGFHVHALGDLSGGCGTTGGHFNPHNQTHGAPNAEVRHVGDLGNIKADNRGVAEINFVDKVISLGGEHCILGRAVVVHSGEDDLGLGGKSDSLTTGHAGDRVACGVIGILTPEQAWQDSNRHHSGSNSIFPVSFPATAILILTSCLLV